MGWNLPIDWSSNELVTATKMNQQIRDNVAYLKKRPLYAVSGVISAATTSTSYIWLGNGLELVFTPEGPSGGKCRYLIGFGGHVYSNVATNLFSISVEVNGAMSLGLNNLRSIQRVSAVNITTPFCWSNILALNVETSYTLRLMWKTENVSYTLNAQNNWHFWALEVGEE